MEVGEKVIPFMLVLSWEKTEWTGAILGDQYLISPTAEVVTRQRPSCAQLIERKGCSWADITSSNWNELPSHSEKSPAALPEINLRPPGVKEMEVIEDGFLFVLCAVWWVR